MNNESLQSILKRTNALLIGDHFVYSSWRHGSVYVNKDAILPELYECDLFARYLAEQFIDDKIDVTLGPAIGGAIFARDVARALIKLTGRKIKPVYTEKSENLLLLKRDYSKLVTNKRVLIIDDIVTTGESLNKTITETYVCGGNIVGLGVMCNRSGLDLKKLIDLQKLTKEAKIIEIFNLKIDSWEEQECLSCDNDIPVNPNFGKGSEFLAKKREQGKIKEGQ